MSELKEIETKTRALLEIKRIRKGLTNSEKYCFNFLEKKYRTVKGRLVKGSYYVDGQGQWTIVK